MLVLSKTFSVMILLRLFSLAKVLVFEVFISWRTMFFEPTIGFITSEPGSSLTAFFRGIIEQILTQPHVSKPIALPMVRSSL